MSCPCMDGTADISVASFRSPLEAYDHVSMHYTDSLPRTCPLRKDNGRNEWYGITGPEDLMDKCALGIDDDLARSLSRSLSSLRTDETLRPVRRRWDVAGGSLSVPRHLSGDPMAFRHRVKGKARARIMEIVMLPTIDATVTVGETEAIGRCIGSVLGLLRGMGYAVGLSTLSLTLYMIRGEPENIPIRGMDIRIKSPQEIHNPRKISFALSRVLARALFLALVMEDPLYKRSYSRVVLPPTYDDVTFNVIDALHPGAKVIFDSNEIITRLRNGWSEEKCIEMLIASVTDYQH